jgi:hypothetical protein
MMEAAQRLLAREIDNGLDLVDEPEVVQASSGKDNQQLGDNIDSQLRLL